MESHEVYAPKPKIAKNKLPDAFKIQSTTNKKINDSEDNKPSTNSKEDNQKDQKAHKSAKGSKNPFLPMKEYFKRME
jgi:hypothetical protein